MIVSSTLTQVAPFIPVVGLAYRFSKTCFRVYRANSPTKALIAGLKGIVIDCTPPVIKYPLLCTVMMTCSSTSCTTGDPNFEFGVIECAKEIIVN